MELVNANFTRRFRRAKTFKAWISRLKSFDYQLIKDNRLQAWTMQDYKNYWIERRGTI